uniref:Uncharacterized protein n=2 Tax=Lygus hesperus TaxID=30085 RepID=A0A146MBR1_LYGHE
MKKSKSSKKDGRKTKGTSTDVEGKLNGEPCATDNVPESTQHTTDVVATNVETAPSHGDEVVADLNEKVPPGDATDQDTTVPQGSAPSTMEPPPAMQDIGADSGKVDTVDGGEAHSATTSTTDDTDIQTLQVKL